MLKYISLILSLSLFSSQTLHAFESDRFMAGISINQNGPKYYFKYNKVENINGFNKERDIKLTSNLIKPQQLNYSGYRNVDGFKNNGRKQDVKFASAFIGLGVLAIVAGAFTVKTVVDAID